MNKCPYCGNGSFYTKSQAYGVMIFHENFDGSPADNTNMYNNIQYRYGKRCFCSRCDKYLFTRKERQ